MLFIKYACKAECTGISFIDSTVIEIVNDELKNICQVEHSRHRSISGFLLNIMGAIAAYSFFPKKPSIKKRVEETNPKLIQENRQQLFLVA